MLFSVICPGAFWFLRQKSLLSSNDHLRKPCWRHRFPIRLPSSGKWSFKFTRAAADKRASSYTGRLRGGQSFKWPDATCLQHVKLRYVGSTQPQLGIGQAGNSVIRSQPEGGLYYLCFLMLCSYEFLQSVLAVCVGTAISRVHNLLHAYNVLRARCADAMWVAVACETLQYSALILSMAGIGVAF